MKTVFWPLILLPAFAAAPLFSARANPVQTTWTTFLRAAPGESARVIGEIDVGSLLDAGPCGGGWCRVVSNRAAGYVPQAVLGSPVADAPPPGAQSCFAGEQFTRHGSGPVSYCPR